MVVDYPHGRAEDGLNRTRAVRVHSPGGPEAMVLEDVSVPEPGPGQARVRVAFAGVNFIDIYHRTGAYPMALPFTPGSEGAGVVETIGDGSTDLNEGDRVAWAMHGGGYAERSIVDAWKLVPVPPAVELDVAAAVMLQGMTGHYLTHSTFPLHEGHVALVHAAAGGVGLLLTQMAKKRGAMVIGTVSTEEKAELARAAGADEVGALHSGKLQGSSPWGDWREGCRRRLRLRRDVDVRGKPGLAAPARVPGSVRAVERSGTSSGPGCAQPKRIAFSYAPGPGPPCRRPGGATLASPRRIFLDRRRIPFRAHRSSAPPRTDSRGTPAAGGTGYCRQDPVEMLTDPKPGIGGQTLLAAQRVSGVGSP